MEGMATALTEHDHPRAGDGRFATKARGEVSVVILSAAGDKLARLEIQFGTPDLGFPDVVVATVMDSASVCRNSDDGTITATGCQGFRYSAWAPDDPGDEDGRAAWGERHQVTIDAVIEGIAAWDSRGPDGDGA